MNPKRLALGYRVCLGCSKEPRWSGVPIINHKTGNEIQIVKDPEVAAEFMAKSARTGFGTLKGMSSSYKRPSAGPDKPVGLLPDKPVGLLPDKPLVDREIGRRPASNEFDAVGAEAMNLLEQESAEAAYALIDKAHIEKRIYRVHAEQLRQIIESLVL
jgi:hypothetical protein